MLLRRNCVVWPLKPDGHWHPYGRVVRFITPTTVEVIWCDRRYDTYDVNDLVVIEGYTGRWDYKYVGGDDPEEQYLYFWRPMATLRQLKQWVGRYDKMIWARRRKRYQKLLRKGLVCPIRDDQPE